MPPDESSLILNSMFESLFERALKPDGAFAEDLRRIGYDPKRPMPEYPERVFLDAMEVARRHTEPGLTPPEAQRKFGRISGENFFDTLIGKVMGVALPMIGPDRLVQSIPKRMETGSRGGSSTIQKMGDRHYRLLFSGNSNAMLEFSAGAIEASLARCNVKPTVTVDPDHPKTGLVITWTT